MAVNSKDDKPAVLMEADKNIQGHGDNSHTAELVDSNAQEEQTTSSPNDAAINLEFDSESSGERRLQRVWKTERYFEAIVNIDATV